MYLNDPDLMEEPLSEGMWLKLWADVFPEVKIRHFKQVTGKVGVYSVVFNII